MSFLIDSNIFIYAADSSLPENARAIETIQQAGLSPKVWCLAWQNIFEFLSVVTNPRAFQGKTLTVEEAMSFVEELLLAPNLRLIGEAEDYWKSFRAVVKNLPGINGPFLHDCHLAALLKEHQVKHLFTADSGFSRFPHVAIVNPFTTRELPFE